MITTILFDFDNTLVDYMASDIAAMSHMLREHRGNLDLDAFLDRSVEVIMNSDAERFASSKDQHYYRFKTTCMEFGIPWDDTFIHDYYDHFIDNVPVFDGVVPLLQQLYGTVQLGILSNSPYPDEQNRRITSSGLSGFFGYIGLAADIGFFKPDKQAFAHALHHFHATPAETVFIGDSEQYDIIGAKNAGMTAIKKLSPWNINSTTVADHTFNEFPELCDLLTTTYHLRINQ